MGGHLRLIGLCLFLMAVVALLSVAAGSSVSGFSVSVAPVYYDSAGVVKCYYNLTAVGESGVVVAIRELGTNIPCAAWKNGTELLSIYPLYYDAYGQRPVLYSDIALNAIKEVAGDAGASSRYSYIVQPAVTVPSSESFIYSAYVNVLSGGLTAIMVAVVAFITLLSLNVVATGLNAFGTRSLTTIMFFGGLWALVSAFGVSVLTSIPFFGWLVYLLLTFVYFLGVWGEINSGGVS